MHRSRTSLCYTAPAHLTAREGGNARGLSGTILAMLIGPLSHVLVLRGICTSMCGRFSPFGLSCQPSTNKYKKGRKAPFFIYGGEAGIRTLGGDKPSTVFKTAAFDHSATSPIINILLNYYLFFIYSNL